MCLSPNTRVVLSLKIQPAPIVALLPFLGFAWVGSFDMLYLLVKHPIVQFVKGFFGGSCSIIVRPAAKNGVEFPQDFL